MGLTSRAKMTQVGVDSVIWGRLTDAMVLADGAPLSLHGYVHPRVEPEVAFLIERPLAGTVSSMQAMNAVGARRRRRRGDRLALRELPLRAAAT